MQDRKALERKFHNKLRKVNEDSHVMETRWNPKIETLIMDNALWVNMKYYAVERKSRKMVINWYDRNCKGKRVLDYCCGNGEDGRIIANSGAREVVGIDLSEVSIENCRTLAARGGLEKTAKYLVRDAEATGFEDNTFDIITEYGALHHIDLEKAFPEMARILRPDGKIICNEALGHNPIIHLYRKMTPHLRTEWEVDHIIRKTSFDLARQHFRKLEMHFFHFCTLSAVPFRNLPFFSKILTFLEALDSVFLKAPGIKWWAWQVVFILSEPKK